MQGGGTVHLCKSLFVLAATNQLLCSSLSLWSSLLVLPDLISRLPRVRKHFLFFSSFQGHRPCSSFSFFVFTPGSYQSTWRSFCLFKFLRPSISTQHVFCENFPICRYIYDVLVWVMYLWQDPCPTPPLLDLRNNLLGHIWLNCQTILFYFHSMHQNSIFFLNILSRLFFFLFFDIDILMDRPCEMASHCGCDLCFSSG